MDQPTSAPEPNDLAEEFVELNDYLREGGDPHAAMGRLVELAVEALPGCDSAAITTWPSGKPPRSLASSDPVAAEADQLQYELGEGPCLTAASEDGIFHIPDVEADERWPRFAAKVHANTPIGAVLSFPLGDDPHRTALNLYAGQVGAFDDAAINVAALFAAHAQVLLLHAASAEEVVNLKEALSASRQIGAAVGILMAVHKVSEQQAFDLLRVSSQHLNRKLREIAAHVTRTGQLPR